MSRRRESSSTPDQYTALALEFRDNCEQQRLMAFTAAEYKNADLPLLAEWYVLQARALATRQGELIELLLPYEAALKGKAA